MLRKGALLELHQQDDSARQVRRVGVQEDGTAAGAGPQRDDSLELEEAKGLP